MSGVSPSSELLAVATAFELSWIEIGTLVTNAANSSFAPFEKRARLVDEVIRPAYTALSN
jgi:adenosine deaminase